MNLYILSLIKLKKQKHNTKNIIKLLETKGEIIVAEDLTKNNEFSAIDLKNALQSKLSKDINFITIIGDKEIIPFYKIENPAEDKDKYVLTDNPYGCLSEEFILPDIPLSRIPSNIDYPDFLENYLRKEKVFRRNSNFGISTKSWEKASISVYHSIKDKYNLLISPPVKKENFNTKNFKKDRLYYFNLHGSDLTPHWYGQDRNEYPIVFSSDDIRNVEGSVIVTEACYGGLLDKRGSKNSIVFEFLLKGAFAVVGSTTISYGPYEPPNQEADLIAKYFFQYLQKGFAFGDAFHQAKTDFTRKMIRWQGFLDEDDKKTLYQFILYGSPEICLE